jgi:hypothetical protein
MFIKMVYEKMIYKMFEKNDIYKKFIYDFFKILKFEFLM